MKLITRNTDYALRAVCYIAQQKKIISVDELVAVLGVPRPFMRKILQKLSQEGITESYKGQGGGFKLKLATKKIYLTAIMSIFQGPLSLNGCFLKKDICPNRRKCVLRKKLLFIEKQALNQLKQINIEALAKG